MESQERKFLVSDLMKRVGTNVILQSVELGEKDSMLDYNEHACDISASLEQKISSGYLPYLRSLRKMSKKERFDIKFILICNGVSVSDADKISIETLGNCTGVSFKAMGEIIDYFIAHFIDYAGLIEKGLALEAPDGFYRSDIMYSGYANPTDWLQNHRTDTDNWENDAILERRMVENGYGDILWERAKSKAARKASKNIEKQITDETVIL